MPSFAMGKELAGLGGLFNRFVTAPLTGAALFNQGRSGSALNQGLQSIPSTRKTDAGRALGNVLGNEMRYMGSQLQRGSLPYLGNEMRYATNELSQRRNPSVSTPERAKGTQAILNGKPVYWTGSKYGWQSGPSAAKAGLLGSEVVGDDVFAPVIGTTLTPAAAPILPAPTQGAADRAYQSAKAETAAMVATDPLMQQWSAAQKAKDYTTADQLGKQIWQNRYGGGPMGQPGGAIGSKNPLMDSTFVYQTGMSPGDIAKTITNPSDIPVSPGEAPYQTGDFGTRLGENGYDATKYGITPEMIEEIRKRQGVEEMKNRLLQQASTK